MEERSKWPLGGKLSHPRNDALNSKSAAGEWFVLMVMGKKADKGESIGED